MNVIIAATILMLSSSTFAAEGYFPPITYQKTIDTYIINKDGSYRQETEGAILIENEQGVQDFGEKDIGYIPELESVEIREAYTLLPNGTRIPVPEKNIQTTNDEFSRGGAMYSDMKHKVVIYPNVVVGSQLYLKYTKTRREPLFPGRFAARMVTSPFMKYGHYEINFIFDQKTNLKLDTKGFDEKRMPEQNGMQHYRYTFKQDKYLPSEPNQISPIDFAPYVQASNFESYETLGQAYQDKARDKVKVTSAIQKLADELTNGVDDKKEQAHRLYNWVSKNIRYVGSYLGNGGFVPHDAQTILDNKWGDCKDHAVILEALLAAKHIESSAALINAGSSYVLPKLPGVYAFNHVITYVPSLDLYLDSTDRFAPFGILPGSDLDKQVVLTALNKVGKTPAMKAQEQAIQTTIALKVMPDGTVRGTSQVRPYGNKEIGLRGRRFYDQTAPQERVINGILAAANQTGVGEIHSTDPTDLDMPLEINASFTLDPVSNFPGPAAMPIPTGVSFGALSAGMLQKPREQVHFPIWCISYAFNNRFQIEFPAKVKIRHIPENVNYSDGVMRYTATYKLNGKRLDITRELVAQYPTMVCDAGENERMKKFFPVFQRDMRAQIIYE